MSDKYVTQPMKGALFAKANAETGEIAKISGKFVTGEGLTIWLEGELTETGSISLVGTMAEHPRMPIAGVLVPEEYNPDYKRGSLVVGKKTIGLNSKTIEDRNGEPYRFIWQANNLKRCAC